MKKINSLIVGMLCSVLFLQAQDAEILAMAYYGKAEEMYTTGNYEVALRKLTEAEKLMAPNPKILYLKVNILNKLNSKNGAYRKGLTESISNFFAITDKNSYPREKYMDIVGIKIDLEDTESKSVGTSINTSDVGSVSAVSPEDIEAEYNKIKNSKRIADLEFFLLNYKNSKFEEDIRAKYYILRDEWNKKEELSRPNLILSTIDNSDDCYVIKDNNKFTSVNGITRISCVLRGRFPYTGNIKIHIVKERGRPEVLSFDSYMSSNSAICVKQNVDIKGTGAFKIEIYYGRDILVLQRIVYID